MKQKITLLLITFISLNVFAQTKITIPRYIKMPKDSITKTNIIADLNSFMQEAENENTLNKYVLPSQKVETYILVDEFKGAERSQGNKHFFKPYLNNIVALEKDQYLIQLSHIGVYDSIPYLRTAYNLIAHKKDANFVFSSPLLANTKRWKSKVFNKTTFFYKDTINLKNVKKYVELSALFDEKLNSTNKTTKIYCAKNRNELLKLIGVDYKLDYNGRQFGTFSTLNGDEQLIISGRSETFDDFDPHDLWHDRLSLVISRRKVNKPVDEGCAYLYGGSWGLSWETIFKQFMEKVITKKNIDWTYYKENKKNFADNQTEHLMVDYVINALIIQKIEKKKGFKGVWELLNCGVFEKGNDNYYKALNKIIGISKENYNKEVDKLIKKEVKKYK